MILIPGDLLKQIVDAAEHAYPDECCGLLVGSGVGARIVVDRLAPSANVSAGSHRDSFEVDPKLRFDVMRDLEGGPLRIVGHYHSHPEHPAEPSERDRAQVWEPDLLWVIVSVRSGQAVHVTAHRFEAQGGRARRIGIRTVA